MEIRLIVTTVGRADPLRRLLESLVAQTDDEVSVTVVDQSPAGVAPIVDRFAGRLRLEVARSEQGASRGRNAGLARLGAAEIVAFPDDDCWYPVDLVARVKRFFADQPEWHGLTVRAVDEAGRPSTARWDRRAGAVTRENVWRRGVAFTMFFRREVVEAVGRFDEAIGPGAGTPWGAGEETDYLLRALARGFAIHYEPDLFVQHPDKRSDLAKAYGYGAGMARVLEKHHYPLRFRAWSVMRPLGGSLVSLVRGRPAEARYRWNVFRGRLAGSLGSAPARRTTP
jgi:GT2 family glycosyltransferase